MPSHKSEFLPFNFAVHGVLEILPNSNNDGFHVNFGSSVSGNRKQDKNVLECLPNDGGYRINLGPVHGEGDDSDSDSDSGAGGSHGTRGAGGSHGIGSAGRGSGGGRHANVSGIIAIRNLDGQYLKVGPDGTLNFNSRVLDREAKWEVKPIEDGKIFLLGANGKYINHFYASVRCQGPSGGWPFVVQYIDDRLVSFECDGEYLSWISEGDGFLLPAKEVNLTSKFTIENFKYW